VLLKNQLWWFKINILRGNINEGYLW
jgi:hypothetical protein